MAIESVRDFPVDIEDQGDRTARAAAPVDASREIDGQIDLSAVVDYLLDSGY